MKVSLSWEYWCANCGCAAEVTRSARGWEYASCVADWDLARTSPLAHAAAAALVATQVPADVVSRPDRPAQRRAQLEDQRQQCTGEDRYKNRYDDAPDFHLVSPNG